MLVEPVQRRAVAKQVVEAGNKFLPVQDPVLASPPTTDAPDPLQHDDPWAAYYKKVKHAPPPVRPVPGGPPARTVPEEGPVAAKFTAQDKRLESLEDAVRTLQTGQERQEKQRQADKEEVASNFAKLSSQVTASIEALQRSQQQQQDQLCQSMNEMKALMTSSRPSSESKKRPASKHDQHMDWEDDNKL